MADELPRGKEKLELIERRLTDRVESRIWRNFKKYGLLVAAGITGFGLVSGSLAISYVTREVTDHVAAQVDKQSLELRNRVESDLVDVVKAEASLNLSIDQAKKQLAILDKTNADLDSRLTASKGLQQSVRTIEKDVRISISRADKMDADFSGRLNTLQKSFDSQFASISTTANKALATASNSSQATAGLQNSLAVFSQGGPTIFSTPSDLNGGMITGANFGGEQGDVFIQPRIRNSAQAKYRDKCSEAAVIGPSILSVMNDHRRMSLKEQKALVSWGNHAIFIGKLPASFYQSVLDSASANMKCSVALSDLEYGFIVQRPDLSESNLAYPFTLGPLQVGSVSEIP